MIKRGYDLELTIDSLEIKFFLMQEMSPQCCLYVTASIKSEYKYYFFADFKYTKHIQNIILLIKDEVSSAILIYIS